MKQPESGADKLGGPLPQKVANYPGSPISECGRDPHLAWETFPPQKYYKVDVREEPNFSFHPDLPNQSIWGYDGAFPGPRFHARYGEPKVGRDIFMYSLTVRPEEDSPEALAQYAQQHGVKPGWKFLTGDAEAIKAARTSLGFYDIIPEVDGEKARHTGMLRFGSESLDRWLMQQSETPPELIVKELLLLERMSKLAAQEILAGKAKT